MEERHQDGAKRARQSALAWSAQMILSLALWVLFTGRLAWTEILVGCGAAVLAAVGAHVVSGARVARFVGHPRWIAQAWRLPRYVLSGTKEIFAVLLRSVVLGREAPSLLYGVPFDVGGDDDASATRRALAITYTTITPNFVVLGFDRERGRMIVHQIEESEVPEMTRRLGARA